MRAFGETENITPCMPISEVFRFKYLAKIKLACVVLLSVILMSCTDNTNDSGADSRDDGLLVEGAYYRLPPPGLDKSAGYLNIQNTTEEDWLLMAVTSESVRAIEIHEIVDNDGQFSMRRRNELLLPAGGSLALKPGGFHLMLFGLEQSVIESASDISFLLRFVAASDKNRAELREAKATAVDVR